MLKRWRRDKPGKKTVVVGLDGVPFSLLYTLIENESIPNIASLFKNGHFNRMEASIPEVSSVSWSSFMTGTQSGEHGIFGFIDLKPGTYRMSFPNFLDLKTRTLFDELGAMGKRSIVINLPGTYPSREIPGILVSGFVAIDLKKAVHPAGLLPRLQEIGYAIDIDTMRARRDHDYLIEELERTLQARERLAFELWENEKWDLFMVVITGTDRIHHYLWNAYERPESPFHEAFLDYYKKVDNFIGKIWDLFSAPPDSGEGKNLFIMLSDHGFTGIVSEVYINRWLEENGYLRFKTEHPKSLEEISSESKAFALDPSRIYLNTKKRYPEGSLDSSDASIVREEIKAGLQELCYEDRSPVIRKVFHGEEIYTGPFAREGPDLVLLSRHGFDLKGKIGSPTVFGRTDLQGMHTQDDAFFFSSKGLEPRSIFEIKEIILNDHRYPSPNG